MTLPVLPPVFGRREEALQEPDRLVERSARARSAPVPGQEHPGQGDVLELAQVAEVVVDGQASLARPAERFSPAAPARSSTRALNAGTGRTLGEKSPTYTRSASSSRSSAPSRSPSASRIRAIATRQRYGFCGNPRCSPSSWLRSRCSRGGRQVVALAVELAHPDVHVRRSPQDRPALLRGELQRLLVGAHRLAETALDDAGCPPARSRTRGRRRCARPAAGPPCTRRTPACAASRSPLAQDASPRSAAAAARPRWSSSARARAPAGRASTVPATSPRARACPARYTRDRTREPAELLLVHDDHLRRPGLAVRSGTAAVASSHRSASRRRASTPSSSPVAMQRPRRSRR